MASPVLERVRGLALPPFDPLNQRAAELREAGHHVVSLGQALPFFPPPAAALDAARASLDGLEVHRYSTDPGLMSLRTILAERLAADVRQPLQAADLIVTAGANHAFTLALLTLVDAGDEVVLPAPYFTNHQMAIVARGAVAVEAAVGDRARFATTWNDLAPHLTSRTKAVVLCTPGNPTGATIAPDDGERIVRECARRSIVVISDETYQRFVYEGDAWSAASVDGWRANVVVISTFSKTFGMMGWRVGYLLADAEICTEATKVQDAMIICAPVVSQVAVEAAVRHAWGYPVSFHDDFRERRRLMDDALRGIPQLAWTPTAGGLFAFTRVHGCENSAALAYRLLEEAHVVTIPGAAFGFNGEGYLRLSYGFASLRDLEDGLARLRRFFAENDISLS